MAQKCYTLLIRVFFAALIMTATMIHAERSDRNRTQLSKPTVTDSKMLDVNEIECFIQNVGPLGENPATGGNGFFYPKGQRERSIIYTAGLWVIGKLDGDIRSAVCQYATEFQPGMILPDGGADDATDPKYKVYKYNKGDDIDQDALDQGCPSEVMGDQMLFSVYNDLASHAGVYTKAPIGVEVQQTAFGFNRTGALGKTVFVRYRFINKNKDGKTLEDAYVGVFFDPDLGDAEDDATGCDPDLGIAYVYNGDDFDNTYGAGPPALCSDFFQGPMVDAPGETAVLPDGTEIPDKKILSMTSYFAFIKNTTLAGLGDPELESAQGATEAYFFVQGFRGNGETWDDPIAGRTTKFPLSGDPVAGTGWLLRHITAPTDVRMGNASGPFQLEPGIPQDVVVGLVIGDGPTNLASVQLMKYNDAQAQMAYNLDFDLPEVPPSPIVEVGQHDGELVLTWDDAAASFDSKGYMFEGFNIYMSEASGGPWTRINTLDVPNSITAIWDQEFDVNLAAIINKPVQFGTDSGVRYMYHIDKDYVNNIPLVNGHKYYFAVTSYAYSENGTPHALETAKTAYIGVPQRPVLDVAYNTNINDEIVPVANQNTDGVCVVTVVDPAKITGDDYVVSFYEDTEEASATHGEILWRLTNTQTGDVLLADQVQSDSDAYLVVEGLLVKVSGPTSGFKSVREIAYAGEAIDGGDNIWHNLNSNSTYFFNSGNGNMSHLERYISYAEPDDFQMQFNDEVNYAVFPFENDLITTVPFALYRKVFGTGEMKRMLPFYYSNVAPAVQPGTNTGEEATWGYPCSDWIYWVDAIDGGYDQFAAICEAEGEGGTYPYATDGSVEGYFMEHPWVVYSIGRTLIADYDLGGAWPPAGTTIELVTKKPVTDEVTFSFSTAGLNLDKNSEVAETRLEDINVFPNPYFGHNKAEDNFFTQFVTFNNLPEENCTLRIFSLSGILVNTLEHNNGTPFERWYLLNTEELPVASGMYIVHVETEFGNKVLKLAIVNREARYQHM